MKKTRTMNYGKTIILIGLLIVLVGIVIYFWGDKLSWFGRLPGDIRIENSNTKFYFPITSMLLVSALLNLFIYIFKKLS